MKEYIGLNESITSLTEGLSEDESKILLEFIKDEKPQTKYIRTMEKNKDRIIKLTNDFIRIKRLIDEEHILFSSAFREIFDRAPSTIDYKHFDDLFDKEDRKKERKWKVQKGTSIENGAGLIIPRVR